LRVRQALGRRAILTRCRDWQILTGPKRRGILVRPGVAGGQCVRSRRYDQEVLAAPSRKPVPPPRVAAEHGLVVEDGAGEFCGAVISCDKDAVMLEDRFGKRRMFPLSGTFLLEGRRVVLIRPPSGRLGAAAGGPGAAAGGPGAAAGGPGAAAGGAARTASGSIPAPPSRAKVARASRIFVEGLHDAELVEKVWGDDLRDVGVVVEHLGGIDDLPAIVADFAPERGRRLGVLVDHLVAGSKESRIAAQVTSPHVLVVGHPYIDVWAAVKPSVAGIRAWPQVPRGIEWKDGVLRAIGWPPDTAAAWRRILGSVKSFADLEPSFLGRVEELIDFVTAPGSS
jgi:hypothetical protein